MAALPSSPAPSYFTNTNKIRTSFSSPPISAATQSGERAERGRNDEKQARFKSTVAANAFAQREKGGMKGLPSHLFAHPIPLTSTPNAAIQANGKAKLLEQAETLLEAFAEEIPILLNESEVEERVREQTVEEVKREEEQKEQHRVVRSLLQMEEVRISPNPKRLSEEMESSEENGMTKRMRTVDTEEGNVDAIMAVVTRDLRDLIREGESGNEEEEEEDAEAVAYMLHGSKRATSEIVEPPPAIAEEELLKKKVTKKNTPSVSAEPIEILPSHNDEPDVEMEEEAAPPPKKIAKKKVTKKKTPPVSAEPIEILPNHNDEPDVEMEEEAAPPPKKVTKKKVTKKNTPPVSAEAIEIPPSHNAEPDVEMEEEAAPLAKKVTKKKKAPPKSKAPPPSEAIIPPPKKLTKAQITAQKKKAAAMLVEVEIPSPVKKVKVTKKAKKAAAAVIPEREKSITPEPEPKLVKKKKGRAKKVVVPPSPPLEMVAEEVEEEFDEEEFDGRRFLLERKNGATGRLNPIDILSAAIAEILREEIERLPSGATLDSMLSFGECVRSFFLVESARLCELTNLTKELNTAKAKLKQLREER